MNRMAVIPFIISTAAFAVESNPCIKPDSSIEIGMMDAMEQDMKIDVKTVRRDKILSQLVENRRVDERLAELYAVIDEKKSPERWLSVKDYKRIYSENNARNLIVKFTYENTSGQHNIFIASAIVNDDECSIRFNGYIVVKREF